MDTHLLSFCLIGGFVFIDQEAVGQFMFSQPLVACTLAGWLFGNVGAGLTIGVLMQLPYLIEMPVGGARLSQINLGAYVAAGLAATLAAAYPDKQNVLLLISLLLGVLISWQGVALQEWLRRFNKRLLLRADLAAANGQLRQISRSNYLGAILAYVAGAGVCAGLYLMGLFICRRVAELTAPGADPILRYLPPLLLGGGVGALLWHFLARSRIKYALYGAVIGTVVLFVNFIR